MKYLKYKKLAYLGIGTNKGDREKNISLALKLLLENKEIKILKVSSILKNPPQEGIKSGYFLNGAIKLITTLSPQELLRLCKKIERRMGRGMKQRGREAEKQRKMSRIIDLDILFYGNEIIETKELTIPHPMIHKRYFVLIPLVEIGKDFIHPVLRKTISELYSDYTPTSIKNWARAV